MSESADVKHAGLGPALSGYPYDAKHLGVECAAIDLAFAKSGQPTSLIVERLEIENTKGESEPESVNVVLGTIPDSKQWGQQSSSNILLRLKQPWASHVKDLLDKGHILTLKNCRVLTRNNNLSVHPYELQLDDGPESKQAHISVMSPRNRLLDKPGIEISLTTIRSASSKRNNKRAETGITAARALKKQKVCSGYIYTPLCELRAGIECNIMAVVVNFTFPKKSRRGDSYIVVTVVDRTNIDAAVQVNIFGPTDDTLPKIRRLGDLIRLHRIKVDSYQGRPSLVYQKTKSSFICIDGRPGQNTEPYSYSTPHYTEVDKEIVASLREWLPEAPIKLIPPDLPQELTSIRNLKRQGKVETVCRVIGITKLLSSGRRYIVVWDGTDIETEGHLIELSKEDCEMLNEDECPENGAYFGVQIDPALLQVVSVSPGDWVHLRNLILMQEEEDNFGYAEDLRVLCSNMKVCGEVMREYVEREDKDSANSEKESSSHEQKETKEKPSSPSANSKPTTRVTNTVRYMTPIHSLKSKYAPCPGKFQLRAKVLSYFPKDITRWCRPVCERCGSGESIKQNANKQLTCSECKSKKKITYHYYFTITLLDATGRQEVIVSRENATNFLQGIPACNLKENEASLKLIRKKIEFILKPESWGHFLVRSYPPSEGNEEDSNIFMLSDTFIDD
mmetsp:Transcript_9024/g.22165  ORF Transcript_9024/g.22165 Transcript_9024/m.22165 type:complete len:677 (+) Transcript_9024:115-2145(+)